MCKTKIKNHYNVKCILTIFEMCFLDNNKYIHNVKFYNKNDDLMIIKMPVYDIYQLCLELNYKIPKFIEDEYIYWLFIDKNLT